MTDILLFVLLALTGYMWKSQQEVNKHAQAERRDNTRHSMATQAQVEQLSAALEDLEERFHTLESASIIHGMEIADMKGEVESGSP